MPEPRITWDWRIANFSPPFMVEHYGGTCYGVVAAHKRHPGNTWVVVHADRTTRQDAENLLALVEMRYQSETLTEQEIQS